MKYYHWEFRNELKSLIESCYKIKPETARRKLNKLIDKYEDLICNDTDERSEVIDKSNRFKNAFLIKKSGKLVFQGGLLFIDNVAYTETEASGRIKVILISGKEVWFDKSFKELFNIIF